MSEKPFFSRRLTHSELNLWLQFEKKTLGNYELVEHLAKSFMDLENSMFFISEWGGETVAATAIYRDSTRRAMSLIGIRILEEHIDHLKTHTVKSSLPFFRSVTIREVDALLFLDEKTPNQLFPLESAIPFWSVSALEANKFQLIEKIYTSSIELGNEKSKKHHNLTNLKFDDIQQLYWMNQSVILPDTSNFWMGLEMSASIGSLFKVKADELSIAFGVVEIDDTVYVTGIITSQDMNDPNLIGAQILRYCSARKISRVVFTILDERQLPILNHISISLGIEPITNEMGLFRRVL